jgi:hypothetical protein
MSKPITAEEFLKREDLPIDILSGDDINYAMVEFTKLHVQAALKAAAEKAELKAYSYTGCFECGREDMSIDENSILNAYPENLIQ